VAIRAIAVTTAESGAQLAETESLTVQLEDQAVIEGMVYVDRQPTSVDVNRGDTDVMVASSEPRVTVTEGQAQIVIKQAAANISVEMPQPVIRIEQPAPEIIITMPAPGVSVANAQPQVEIRQSEPIVTVTQAAPAVSLELRRAAEGSDGSLQITDRATGEAYAPGASGTAQVLADTTVNLTQNEPTITYQDVATDSGSAASITRTEPIVTFESADPMVTFASAGEPQIEMVQTGEPMITFLDAADASQPEMTESEMAAEADAIAVTGVIVTDPAGTDTMAATDPTMGAGPMVEREGYTRMMSGDVPADRLIGMTVYGINDENVGEISDLILGTDAASSAAIIGVGGFLGIGEKDVQVPFGMLTFLRSDNDDIRIFVDSTEDRLKNMETYNP
jgi:sporulation protein YlmC with PRC-barrel domain